MRGMEPRTLSSGAPESKGSIMMRDREERVVRHRRSIQEDRDDDDIRHGSQGRGSCEEASSREKSAERDSDGREKDGAEEARV